MSNKKRYRIRKARNGEQVNVVNPMQQFMQKAAQGMQQPSPEQMAMMQQEQMLQQQSASQSENQVVQVIAQGMQQGVAPQEIIAKLLQGGVSPNEAAEGLLQVVVLKAQESGKQLSSEEGQALQNQVQEIVGSVMQQLEGGQEQGQPSEEEMMAMQQQQMAEQAPPQEQPTEEAPMSKGGYVKKRLKMAQEGMEQNGVKASNTNLAAEDDVNNSSAIINFSKNNALKNQYEQEYNQMQGNQDMMPEARLGREARQERREIRQDGRTERTAMRQADRSNRQAQRVAGRAMRQVTSPFGRVPGFSAYSPSPFMGGAMGDIELDVRERGLFGQLKSFKMNIDGMGFPARFSEGMFMNALHNPYAMPAGQSRIVKMLTKPGQVVDNTVVKKDEAIKFQQKVDAEGSGGSSDAFNQYVANDMRERLNRIKNGQIGSL